MTPRPIYLAKAEPWIGKPVIKVLGLSHPAASTHHPNRAAGSPWIEVRFATAADVKRVVELVRLAVAKL